MTDEESKQLKDVVAFMNALKAASTIPLEVDRALRARLNFPSIPITIVSSKNADSEDQAVAEGGAASYSVMGDPVGFLQMTVGNTAYQIPYFNA